MILWKFLHACLPCRDRGHPGERWFYTTRAHACLPSWWRCNRCKADYFWVLSDFEVTRWSTRQPSTVPEVAFSQEHSSMNGPLFQ